MKLRCSRSRPRLSWYTLLFASLLVVGFFATGLEAATFWDWLWGRSPYYQHPWNRTYTPAVVTPTTPITLAPAPTVAAPTVTIPAYVDPCATTAFDPCPTPAYDPCAPVTAAPGVAIPPRWHRRRAAPQFRSSWFRVPVTTYRPVTVFDPLTGNLVSQVQPCNHYTWQLRRVPARGGLFSWFQGSQRVSPALPAPGAVDCTSVAPLSSAPSASPYYVPPASPATRPPPTWTPPAPASPSDSPAGATPADQPPELGSGTGGVGSFGLTPRPRSNHGHWSADLSNEEAGRGPATTDVVPLRDPDQQRRESQQPLDIPPLLEPPNHTAANPARDRSWEVSRVAFPRESSGPTLNDARQELPPADITWDDTGWGAAR